MSAFSVVTPAATACSEYSVAQARCPSACRSGPRGSRSAAPSSRRRRAPTAPRRCRGRSCWTRSRPRACPGRRRGRGARGVVLVACEHVRARERGHVRACPTSRWPARAAWGAGSARPVALHRHAPTHRPPRHSAARLAVGGAPVVELHHPRVHLQPVGDLVLGREHRPVGGELDVGQVVVPDRVVQAQRLVALAPRVARALALRSTMIVGTPSWRSRAPSAIPPWPPPMITT